jgi:hypothetical protein
MHFCGLEETRHWALRASQIEAVTSMCSTQVASDMWDEDADRATKARAATAPAMKSDHIVLKPTKHNPSTNHTTACRREH